MSEQPKRVLSVIGRVGKDPVTKKTTAGAVVEFSLAVTTSYEDGVPAKWFDISVWNPGLIDSVQAEVYKGAHVGVEGFYSVRTTDRGEFAKISAHNVYLLDPLAKSAKEQAAAPIVAPVAAAPAPAPRANSGSDLPF